MEFRYVSVCVCVCVCQSLYITYEDLSFTLCNDATLIVSHFHARVHQRSTQRDKGLRAGRQDMSVDVTLAAACFNTPIEAHTHRVVDRSTDSGIL